MSRCGPLQRAWRSGAFLRRGAASGPRFRPLPKFSAQKFSIGAGNMGITGVKNESSLSCAMVNREAVRARQTVIAATRRQSWRAARQGGYSVKTVRELSVGGSCVTLGLVLRETDRRISYRDRHGRSRFISTRWAAAHTEPCPSCPDFCKREMFG